MGKSLILAVQIIGDARSAIKATEETTSALDKMTGPAAVAGGAAGAALSKGFMDAVSAEAGMSKVKGQLALSESEAARVGKVSADLYADGWGEGSEQINEALSQVIGNIEGMRGATETELAGVSQSVLTLANTFDQDLGGITTAVGQMMRTGMAKDADEALDIITKGLQGNARAGEDLLDTFTEYPALFERLGIDGQTATGLIKQGLDAGARSTDLVADALKEFQIRATDGSQSSAEGFELLGLSAAEMTAQIAAGGKGASAGLDTVLDRLRGMTDPVQRNAAAVALFGTQAEDLGGALFALDPSAATAALGEVGGAATQLSDTVRDNAQTTIETFFRKVQTSFSDIAAKAIPLVEPILDFLGQFAPILGPLAVVIALVAGAILVMSTVSKAYTAVQSIQTAAQLASNAAWLASPITWIVLAVIAAIGLLIVAIVLVVKNWDKIKDTAAKVWQAVIDWIKTAIGWVRDRVNDALTAVTRGWVKFRAGVAAVWQAIIGWIRDAIGWLGEKITEPILAVKKFFEDLRDGAVKVFKAIIKWIKEVIAWIGELVGGMIPDWVKDIFGGGAQSMDVTPQVQALTVPTYQAAMTVTPVADTQALSAVPMAAQTMTALALLTGSLARSQAATSNVYNDNRRFEFPQYVGDKGDLVDTIKRELKADERRRKGDN